MYLERLFSFIDTLESNLILEKIFSLFIKLLWQVFSPIVNFPLKTVFVNGYYISFRPLLRSDWKIIDSKFENEVKKIFKPLPNQVVIDIGAHIGIYTLLASKMVGEKGKVISIEPDEKSLKILYNNININNFKNIIVIPNALSEINEEKNFYKGIMPSGSSFIPSINRKLYKIRDIEKVKTITLDYLIDALKINCVNWIKIDAENMDFNIIEGSVSTLKKYDDIQIIIEVSNIKTIELLVKMNYKVKKIDHSYFYFYK
jgi:FkbM family methyltransferase